ncbi:MAG: glycosyltransferase family 2 protein [Planctomycetota bacterium]|jgi:GT2 family glycosyltransferase
MVDLSIIIVGTNEKDFVYKCLDSILKSKVTYSVETILVDNASTDGTSSMVKDQFDSIELICNQEKKGYIYNNNLAMRKAKGRYILLLNADIELQYNTLQVMVDFMDRHKDVAVSACRLTFDDGTLQLTCRRFPTPLTYICRVPHFFHWIKIGKKFAISPIVHKYLMMDYDHKENRDVDWFLSAFFLMRRSAIDDLGMLDEKLVQPFYLEDMDWCFKAHVKGWRVCYVPEVYAVHHYRRDSVKKFGKLSIVHLLNIIIFFKKHAVSMLLHRHRKKKL